MLDYGNGGIKVFRDNKLVWLSLMQEGRVLVDKPLPLFDTEAKAAIVEHLARAAAIAVTAGLSRDDFLNNQDLIAKALDSMGVLLDLAGVIEPVQFVTVDQGRHQYSFTDTNINAMVSGEYGLYAEIQDVPDAEAG